MFLCKNLLLAQPIITKPSWRDNLMLIGSMYVMFKYLLFNKPGVAGAVIQTSLSFIDSLSQWLNLCENIFKTLSLSNRNS